MGASGAGKSTLLNILSGRIGPGILTGQVTWNGLERNSSWRRQCTYLPQNYILLPKLTVFETLMYAAMLKLPKTMSRLDKRTAVFELIELLGLNDCMNARVGDEGGPGISGGERRRVGLGVELLARPSVLLVDEVTSGLDASSSLKIVRILKNLAKTKNVLVIMTIHQPRNEILALIDNIYLVGGGKCVFDGSPTEALDHFSLLGYPIPENTNPGDYYLDLISFDDSKDEAEERKRLEILWNAQKRRSVFAPEDDISYKALSSPPAISAWNLSIVGEFFILFHRSYLSLIRSQMLVWATLAQGVFFLIVYTILYYQIPDDSSGILLRVYAFFMLSTTMTVDIAISLINVFPEKKKLVSLERASGTYRPVSAFFAELCSNLPLLFLENIIFMVPFYWLANFGRTYVQFGTYLAIILVHSASAQALGLMIGSAAPDIRTGQTIAPVILVAIVFFGGFKGVFVKTLPVFVDWIGNVSMVSYSLKAFLENEFKPMTFIKCAGFTTTPCFATGQAVLDFLSLDFTRGIWFSIGMNAVLGVFNVVAGCIFFSYSSKPFWRLK
ncbi:ATP-binding cassette sub- G member 2 [Kappamyces sp. JEL0680]|nr:ATP-binding cassette sub- G member 2 [Kappamyces sp. JEL0680]